MCISYKIKKKKIQKKQFLMLLVINQINIYSSQKINSINHQYVYINIYIYIYIFI